MPPFRESLQPDASLRQNARFRFDAADRQGIDSQIIACELFLSTCLLNGIAATYGTAASALAAGDVVCLAGAAAGTVTLALPTPLAAAGRPAGVVLEAAAQGAKVRYAVSGAVPPSVTGLATSAAGAVRVSSLGRLERVDALVEGDFGVGAVDAAGWLSLGAASVAGALHFGDGPVEIITGHAATGAATRSLLRWGSAVLDVGDEADELNLDAAELAHLGVAGSKSIYVTASGIQLFGGGAVDFAGGAGVIGCNAAGTEPTGNPGTGKIVAWLYGGALKVSGPNGLTSTLARDADAAQTLQVDDRWWRTVQTTDVAAGVATYPTALPINSQFGLELNIYGIKKGTALRCHFKVIASGGRGPSGAMVVDATDVQTIYDGIGVSAPPTVSNNADAPQLNCLGRAATIIDWTSVGTIRIWSPLP